MKRNEDNLRGLWDNIKHTNIHTIMVPEGEKRKGPRKYVKRQYLKTSLTGKGSDFLVTQVQDAQRAPYRINSQRNTQRHIVIKMTTIKENNTSSKEKVTSINNIQRNSLSPSANFSAKTLKSRREWHNISKVMKRKNLQLKILYLA